MTTNSSGTSLATIDVGGDRHDELFAALSHTRRRFVLHALQQATHDLSVSELASDLVSREADMTESRIVDDTRASIEVSLIHSHLPKLDDVGLVNYDDEAGTVWLTDPNDELGVHFAAVQTPSVGGD